MTDILKRYTIDTFERFDTTGYSLNEDVIGIINNLAKLVGAPEYRKTPVFKKNSRNKPNSISEKDWESIRNFKTTIVSKNDEGVNKHISDIRTNLNKLTRNNYDDMSKKVLGILKLIVEDAETTDQDLNDIGKSIFETSTTNKFWCNLYSELYNDILNKYPAFKTICYKNLMDFMILFNDIRYVDAEKDYDLFCTINKENEKRQALGKFFSSLMNKNIIEVDKIGDIVLNLIDKFKTNVDKVGSSEIVDEIGENIFILIRNGNEKLSEEFKDYDEISCFIKYVTELDYTKHVSVSSKITFKFMDLEEELF
jgi:hypothetical protein